MPNLFVNLKRFDWRLNLPVLVILGAGLLSLASTKPVLFERQLLWIGIGILIYFLIIKFDWRPFINYRWFILGIYFLLLLLLAATYFFAPSVRGAKSWLPLGPFQFQPSEIAKLVLIMVYA